jgi:hypothetical protein
MQRGKSIKIAISLTALVLCWVTGCAEKKPESASAGTTALKHEHKPLHGGTAVELGKEEYHLELVLDASTGKMQAYVMDGELENFVRIAAESIEVLAKLPGKEETLVFKAVASNATGETVGNTSLFETQADWLKSTREFDAVLKSIVIKSSKYENVPFNFPKGNESGKKPKK